MADPLVVLIASPLEPEHVARIRAVDPRLEVLWDPELLPRPRYVSDHTGPPTSRTPAEDARFREMLGRAEVSSISHPGIFATSRPLPRACAGCRRRAPALARRSNASASTGPT